jgi:uncharacterized protein YndB with AHSA1/START domain
MRVDKRISIEAPRRQVYDQWTRFEDYPQFMAGVIEVNRVGDDRLHWRAETGGQVREWTTRIIRCQPNEIAWQTEEDTPTTTEVRLSGDEDRTEVEMDVSIASEDVDDRAGAPSDLVDERVQADLLRFKQFVEDDNASLADLGQNEPSGRSATDIGKTESSDLSREGLSTQPPLGRGAMAYGGRGNVGEGGRNAMSSLGGQGRGSEGGPLGGPPPVTGGLGGQGRGMQGQTRGGGASNLQAGQTPSMGMGGFPEDTPLSESQTRADAAAADTDVSIAGGAGNLNEEDRIASQGILGQGGAGRESQSTEGPEQGVDDTGAAGDDRPVDYRGESRPGSTNKGDRA